jgi:hypothetical protein
VPKTLGFASDKRYAHLLLEKIEWWASMSCCYKMTTRSRTGGNISGNTLFNIRLTSNEETNLISRIISGVHKTPLWGKDRYTTRWVGGHDHDPTSSDPKRIREYIRDCPNSSRNNIIKYIRLDKHFNSEIERRDYISGLLRELDKQGFFSPVSSS